MHFQIRKKNILGDTGGVIATRFVWALEKKEGQVCQSGRSFDSEREARSDIAQAKKSFRATSRSKVFSPGEGPE